MNSIHSGLTDRILRVLSEQLNIPVRLRSTRPSGGGCINHASLLETSAGRFFLKWNGNCPADMFLREAEGLNELKKASPDFLVIPEVVATSEIGEFPGFIVLEYLEENHTGNGPEELGRGLAILHKFSGEKFGFPHDNYCGTTLQKNNRNKSWCDFYAYQRLGSLLDQLKSRRAYRTDEIKLLEQLLIRLPELLPSESTPVLIHGDLWSGNYMHTVKGPALIDPAACYADREMEMGIMTLFGGFSTRFWNAYNGENPLPRDWEERNKLYQLYHVLNHYLLFGGGYGRQALEIARHYL